MGQLNELQIKAAQPRDKEYMLSDGEGLYHCVRPNGKVWLCRYKQAREQAKLSLGSYPTVTLAIARRKARDEAERRAGGIDPRDARREQQERDRVARLNTFELTARAWHAQAQKDRQWSANYAEKVMRHLELHVFPWIGSLAMEAIKPTERVRCMHRIRDRGNLETAQRVRGAVQHVFQCAVVVGALEPAENFVNGRTGGLPPPRARDIRPLPIRTSWDSCYEAFGPTTEMSLPVPPCSSRRCCSSDHSRGGWEGVSEPAVSLAA